ncbi:MAG: PorV/PorQ family protein [Elusimicrobiota bacterium]
MKPGTFGIAVLFCCTFSAASNAAAGGGGKGTGAAQFLKLGVGARAVGMGEAYSAAADEASALYWNPAGLNRINGNSATFMRAVLLGGVVYDYLAFGRKADATGAWGASLQYLSAGGIYETDSTGFNTGSEFNPKDLAFTAGYARGTRGFDAGLSIKYIRSEIVNTAWTLAADFGVLSPPLLNKKLRLSLAAQNIGGRLKFDRESDALPVNVRLGSALSLTPRWTAALDLNLPYDNAPFVGVGGEYRIDAGSAWSLAARLGYNSRTFGDIEGINGFSYGLGWAFGRLEFDYALLPFSALGATHRLSMSTRWGGGTQNARTQPRKIQQPAAMPERPIFIDAD